jgi:uncharacterized protein DUF3471
MILNLNKGKVSDKQIISEASLAKIHSPLMVYSGTLSRYKERFFSFYGMGWGITSYRGHPVIAHDGGIDGFISDVSFLPNDNVGVVILTNSDSGGPLNYFIARNIYDRVIGGKQIPWVKRFKEREAEREKDKDKDKKKKDADRVLNTKPSHKLEDYTGEYENPGYGILSVKKEGEKENLNVTFNGITYKAKHYHYDIFKLTYKLFGDEEFNGTFHTHLNGNIQTLSISFQTGVKDIQFTRIPEKKLKDKEYLKKFVGDYDLKGTLLKVILSPQNVLHLIIKGQPKHTLVPYKEAEFSLKGLKGFSIKFILNDNGDVTTLESHQPKGIFTAQKKK